VSRIHRNGAIAAAAGGSAHAWNARRSSVTHGSFVPSLGHYGPHWKAAPVACGVMATLVPPRTWSGDAAAHDGRGGSDDAQRT